MRKLKRTFIDFNTVYRTENWCIPYIMHWLQYKKGFIWHVFQRDIYSNFWV